MKGIKKTKFILIIVAFIVTCNIFPYVVRRTLASSASDVIKKIALVKTNDDTTFATVSEGELVKEKESKYYVQLDWDIDAAIPNEVYEVTANGLLFENSQKPYEIILTDGNNNSLGYPAIGTVNVQDNKIAVKFNETIASSQIQSLGNINGKFLVRASVDINNFQTKENFAVSLSLDAQTKYSVNLRHEMIITDFSSKFKDLYHSDEFKATLQEILPGETFEVKVNIVPHSGYTIDKFNVGFRFNDYSLDFFEGKLKKSDPEMIKLNPSFMGETITDYEFIRESTTERRPDSIADNKDAKLAVMSDWGFYPKTMKEFSQAQDFNYYFSVNGKYTNNDFQGYSYSITTILDPIYKVEKYDEIIIYTNSEPSGEPENTNVIVKFIGYDKNNNEFEMLPDKVYNDVPMISTEYYNYVVEQTDVQLIQDKGYYIDDIKQLTTLSPEKDKNIIYVYCRKCCTEGFTNVIVRFLYEEPSGKLTPVLNDRVYDKVPLDATEFYAYVVEQEDRDNLTKNGYSIIRIESAADPLSSKYWENFVYVYVGYCETTPSAKPTSTSTATSSPGTSTTTATSSPGTSTSTSTSSSGTSTSTSTSSSGTSTSTSTPSSGTSTSTSKASSSTTSTTTPSSSTSSTPGTMTATYESTKRTTTPSSSSSAGTSPLTSTTPPTSTYDTNTSTPVTSAPPATTYAPSTPDYSPGDPGTDIPDESIPWDINSPSVSEPGGDKVNPETFDKAGPILLIILMGALIIVIDKFRFLFTR